MSIIEIPDGTTHISDEAFINRSDIASVSFPSSLTSIGKLAFANCSKLVALKIPDTITFISNDAFDNCNNLGIIAFGEKSFRRLSSWKLKLNECCKIKLENRIYYIPTGEHTRDFYYNHDYITYNLISSFEPDISQKIYEILHIKPMIKPEPVEICEYKKFDEKINDLNSTIIQKIKIIPTKSLYSEQLIEEVGPALENIKNIYEELNSKINSLNVTMSAYV